MLVVCYLLVFALLTTHLSQATAGIGAASCLDCPLEDGDSRGKLSFNPVIPAADEDFLKAIALASSSPGILGGGRGGGGIGPSLQQQKAKFYREQQQQRHQKILAQQQQRERDVPSSALTTLSTGGIPALAPPPPPPPPLPSNLLRVYALLNKGSVQEPRLLIDDYYLQQDPRAALLANSPRIAKKAERGMLVDVMDYVSKPDDRNRRVGQNMRSSG